MILLPSWRPFVLALSFYVAGASKAHASLELIMRLVRKFNPVFTPEKSSGGAGSYQFSQNVWA